MPTQHKPADKAVAKAVVPNAARRDNTRRIVLRAAAEAFDDAGYLAAPLEEIVRRTGMTKGAVYFHFKSKDDLAATLVNEHYLRLEELAAEAQSVSTDNLSGLIHFTYAVASALKEDVALRAGGRLAAESHTITAELTDPYQWWVDILIGFARRAKRDGSLVSSLTPAAVARTAATFFLGAQHPSRASSLPGDLHRRLDDFWALVEPVLRGRS